MTPEDITTVKIYASSLATDLNKGYVLTFDSTKLGTGAEGPQYGTVHFGTDANGSYLTYTPTTLDYEVDGILTGNQDAFQVGLKDNFGGTVTSFVEVKATPVADTPTLTVTVLKDGSPVNEVHLMVTAQSGDYGTMWRAGKTIVRHSKPHPDDGFGSMLSKKCSTKASKTDSC